MMPRSSGAHASMRSIFWQLPAIKTEGMLSSHHASVALTISGPGQQRASVADEQQRTALQRNVARSGCRRAALLDAPLATLLQRIITTALLIVLTRPCDPIHSPAAQADRSEALQRLTAGNTHRRWRERLRSLWTGCWTVCVARRRTRGLWPVPINGSDPKPIV